MDTPFLHNHLAGRWQAETPTASTLVDPVTGAPLARAGGAAEALDEGFAFARRQGRSALQAMSYGERAAMLTRIGELLKSHRDEYLAISLANSGTTAADSSIDVDGASYTLGYYARLGATLGDTRLLLDGTPAALAKDGSFQSQHVLAPVQGLALLINAFNFPAWGLWEKAAPALLSGVPVIVKPATVTAWLTQRMVHDVIEAGLVPAGALSIVCGSSQGLLDALQPLDVLSFTGSADTAALIRSHRAVARDGVRANIEADSLNAALLGPDALPGTPAFDLFVGELVRELATKSGQRCTCIRRALVPQASFDAVAQAVSARLAELRVGNPRHPQVRMGSLVGRAQLEGVRAGIAALQQEAPLLVDGRDAPLVDADPAIAACIGPTLLGMRNGADASLVHRHEVFGPAATLLGTVDTAQAIALAQRGEGSLVTSLVSADDAWLARSAAALAASNGRVHAIGPAVARSQTGHGNVMPQSVHGGPGRAGGGEELGGWRALRFYHRRSALQMPQAALATLAEHTATLAD
ncbi:MAG TPA: 3,4-dehydroadipyl-CoA semialdehyde dehydrogenase [Albitalea sp.]|nr:3,4-dehydroadipyl-CoA semialdehyde dehydrogenase [Albitalea sp.]